jgi:hypothetical protein
MVVHLEFEFGFACMEVFMSSDVPVARADVGLREGNGREPENQQRNRTDC